MAACFKVNRTREHINTHQPLVKTKKNLFENNSRPLKRWEARAERVWPRETRVISLLCNLYDNDQVPWGWLPPHRLPASYATGLVPRPNPLRLLNEVGGAGHETIVT